MPRLTLLSKSFRSFKALSIEVLILYSQKLRPWINFRRSSSKYRYLKDLMIKKDLAKNNSLNFLNIGLNFLSVTHVNFLKQ